jgi:predicted lipoprotein with Yx(FWY)xxD motif
MIRNRLALPVLIVTILAIVAVIAATSGGSKKAPQQTGGSAISIRQTSVGKALVDANGRTLYLFAGDKPNLSRLSTAGRAVWPAYTSAAGPTATGGASAAQIGTVAATKQITYNGHPLYYYVGDRKAGQASGQALNEFGARWYVLSAAGAPITTVPSTGSASPSGTSPSPGGPAGYGY